MKLLAVTACPVGIAHTYIAAEKLKKAAEEAGHTVKVETWGSIGVENAFTKEEIEEADGVILAADKDVDKSRFRGKRVLECSVQDAIHRPEELIKRLVDGEVPVFGAPEREEPKREEEPGEKAESGRSFYRNLMNGVSYMIPFVVVGGLLIALSLGFGGKATPEGFVVPDDSIWKPVLAVGETGFLFMVPVLAGYIAYSIADRPGLAPGMIGGYIAADGSFYGSEAGAGFIGGIIAGFLAGYLAKGIRSIRVPKVIQPIMPILVIPLVTSLLTALLFIHGIGAPISGIMSAMTEWLHDMQGTGKVALALVLGAMIAFDMGGPINKVLFVRSGDDRGGTALHHGGDRSGDLHPSSRNGAGHAAGQEKILSRGMGSGQGRPCHGAGRHYGRGDPLCIPRSLPRHSEHHDRLHGGVSHRHVGRRGRSRSPRGGRGLVPGRRSCPDVFRRHPGGDRRDGILGERLEEKRLAFETRPKSGRVLNAILAHDFFGGLSRILSMIPYSLASSALMK